MLKNFIKLDFITARPGFNWGAMLFYVALIVLMTAIVGSMTQTVWLMLFFLNSFIALPFAMGEKHNMDALYVNLNVNRKTVVLGRYLYSLIIWVCGVIITYVLVGFGLLVEGLFSIDVDAGMSAGIGVALAIMLMITQAFQLPIYFKFSHAKSHIWTLIPFIGLMLGSMMFSAFIMSEDTIENIAAFFANPSGWVIAIAGAIATVGVIVFASYKVSLKFYSAREF